MHVWALGLSCETPAAHQTGPPGLAHDNPRTPNVHISGHLRFKTPPKFHGKTPQRERHNENETVAEREEKARNFGPPTLSGLHPSGPHPSGPHPSGPHRSGPHRSGPHRSGPHPSGPHPSGPHPSGLHPSGVRSSMLFLLCCLLFCFVLFCGCPCHCRCRCRCVCANKRTECTSVGENCNGQLIVRNNVTEMWREI